MIVLSHQNIPGEFIFIIIPFYNWIPYIYYLSDSIFYECYIIWNTCLLFTFPHISDWDIYLVFAPNFYLINSD